MKIKRTRFLILCLFSIFFMQLKAQPVLRNKAHHVLKRTTMVILAAQRTVRTHKVYTGNLSRSVAHQRLARRLFIRHKYVRAIHHSRYARLLAIKAIRANRGVVDKTWEFDNIEQDLGKNTPDDKALDNELEKEMPGVSMKDEDIVGANLEDIDISDIEPQNYKGK